MHSRSLPLLIVLGALAPLACNKRLVATASPLVEPVAATAAVADDADDPAVWINAADHSRSLILGTNKVASPGGALYVFGLDGKVTQVVKPLDRPNNVDVEYGLATPQGPIDIAVVTERLQNRLRVYRITADGLTPLDGGGIRVLEGETGEGAMPMGISLYRRPRDGQIYAVIAPKTGGTSNYLWQYRLSFDADGGSVRGTLVRRFGSFSGKGEIEAVAIDDELGYVYYSDEEFAIRKWAADPDDPRAGTELGTFGRGDAFARQREGIAIVGNRDGTGYIICTDQIPGGSVLRVFRREGRRGEPDVHDGVANIVTAADTTDGIEATTTGLGDRFPAGMVVMMNSAGRNFQFYDMRRLLERIESSSQTR